MNAVRTTYDRRQLLTGLSLVALAGSCLPRTAAAQLGLGRFQDFGLHVSEGPYEVTLTEAQWRERLSDLAFAVLRQEATERPFTSALEKEARQGNFHCGGCDLPVYASASKFDSKTGWPSFTAPLPDAVRVKPDRKLFSLRTEVHCRRCGGHFGHIFDDGPQPTGQRHCLNGAALTFKPLDL